MQNGLATKIEKSRKQMKERKNIAKKISGVKKVGEWTCIVVLADGCVCLTISANDIKCG